MFSVTRNLSTIELRKEQKCLFLGEEITGTKITNPKSVPVSSPSEDVVLGIIFVVIFNGTFQVIRHMKSLKFIQLSSG
jgi:hypothetical protein